MRHSYFARNFSLPAVPPPDGLRWIQPPPSESLRWIVRDLPLEVSRPLFLDVSSSPFRTLPLSLPRLLPQSLRKLQRQRHPFRRSRRSGSRPDKSCRPSFPRYPEFPSAVPESSRQAVRGW